MHRGSVLHDVYVDHGDDAGSDARRHRSGARVLECARARHRDIPHPRRRTGLVVKITNAREDVSTPHRSRSEDHERP